MKALPCSRKPCPTARLSIINCPLLLLHAPSAHHDRLIALLLVAEAPLWLSDRLGWPVW